MSFNRVILMGNLTRDPETRFAKSGTAVVGFSLALNEKQKDGPERVTFVDVTMFGKRGEAFAKFHRKGDQAMIEGKLRLDTWEDKNGGGKRSKLYVVGDSFEFVGGKQQRGESRSTAAAGDAWGGQPTIENEGGPTPF